MLIFAPNFLYCPYNLLPYIRKHAIEYMSVVAEKFIQVEVILKRIGLEQ
ncbi:hypothetical protein [Candidatus Borrarchaeum sp.]|nr:hypothetical protein [Candidatus Borrarchaeum sp.]